jgi:hypothetical protein
MNVVELKVLAYVEGNIDLANLISEYLLDSDMVSYCDVDTVSEKGTSKTFPEDDQGVDDPDDDDEPETERAKIERWDFVDNTIKDMLKVLNPSCRELKCDIHPISEIREIIIKYFVEELKICTEEEFYS